MLSRRVGGQLGYEDGDPRHSHHCWTDRGIFNIEGGCYAKAIDLTPESEPEIFQALRFGSVLEKIRPGT